MEYKRTGASAGVDRVGCICQDAASEQRPTELEIEKEWLERARVDGEAFGFFYRKYRPRIFRQILSMTRDNDVAADLTQETFIRAFIMLDTFTWRGRTFWAWLASISRSLVFEESRRRKIRREIWFDPDLHDDVDGARPEVELEIVEEARILCDCMKRLGPGQLKVLESLYNHDQTTKEIALALGVAESTAKSRLQQGRRQLRVWLVECGVDWRGDESRRGGRESAI